MLAESDTKQWQQQNCKGVRQLFNHSTLKCGARASLMITMLLVQTQDYFFAISESLNIWLNNGLE